MEAHRPPRRRLFFALWPDLSSTRRLIRITESLRLAGSRPEPPPDLHVTICFLGSVEDSMLAALCERAAQLEAKAFELEFSALEYWRRPRVIAAICGQTPAAALELAEALRANALALGLAPDEKPFRAHLTLLRRVAAGSQALEFPQPLTPPLRLTVCSFHLVQSREREAGQNAVAAARYIKLASWPLRR